MARESTGNAYQSRGRFYARITIGLKQRQSFVLDCTTLDAADERANLLARLAAKMRGAGCATDRIVHLIKRAATRHGKALDGTVLAIEDVCSGEAKSKAKGSATPTTYRDVALQWTSGELARRFPDRVRVTKSGADDLSLLEKHAFPVVGDIPVVDFTLDDAERVLSLLPSSLEGSSRRQIASKVARPMTLAAMPLRLIKVSPIPRGWLPLAGPRKALAYLYPDEDRKLLASRKVPLRWRMYYGWQAREGTRPAEGAAMTWGDLDLVRGAVSLDENKTDDPRTWALSPGMVAALLLWKAIRKAEGGDVSPTGLVFVGFEQRRIPEGKRAGRLRDHLVEAGIDRAELFERTSSRRPLRAHDLRATFVTIALANGRSEAWISDRTGHKSSDMINKYRRAARSVAELGLGDLTPLDEAIPELAASRRKGTASGGGGALASADQVDRGSSIDLHLKKKKASKKAESRDSGSLRGNDAGELPRVAGPGAASEPPAALSASPRKAMAIHLADSLRDAIDAGDMQAARVASDALAQLLGSDIASGKVGDVVDLATRRRKATR